MMNNSDIIAIVAIVVSGVVTVAAIISNIFTNRANIVAKRKEMAFAEQLKVFSSLVEKVTDIELQRSNIRLIRRSIEVGQKTAEGNLVFVGKSEMYCKLINVLSSKVSKLYETTLNYSIFLPPDLLKEIIEYTNAMKIEFPPIPEMTEAVEERIEEISTNKTTADFITKMRSFILIKEK